MTTYRRRLDCSLKIRGIKWSILTFASAVAIGLLSQSPTIVNASFAPSNQEISAGLTNQASPANLPANTNSTTNITYEPTQVTIPNSAETNTSAPNYQLSIEALSTPSKSFKVTAKFATKVILWNRQQTQKVSQVKPGKYLLAVRALTQSSKQNPRVEVTISNGTQRKNGWLQVKSLPSQIRKRVMGQETVSDQKLTSIGRLFNNLQKDYLKSNNPDLSQDDSKMTMTARKLLANFMDYYQNPIEKNYQHIENHYTDILEEELSQTDLKNNLQIVGYHTNLTGNPKTIVQKLFSVWLAQTKATGISSIQKTTKFGNAFKVVNGRIVGQTVMESPVQDQKTPKTVTVQTPVKTVTVTQPVATTGSGSTSSNNTSGKQPQADNKWTAIDQKVTQLLQSQHVSGRVVVVKNGASHSINVGNATNSVKNADDRVVFPLASLQKVITGAIFTQLVNETHAKLNQKEPLSDYFPKVPNANKITIRDLLDHVSGIDMSETTPPKVLSEDEAIQYTLDNLKTPNQPEQKFDYTNANYTLLAGILKKVAKQSYEQLVTTRIIQKLGLQHTFFWDQKPSDAIVAESSQSDGKQDNLNPAYPSPALLSSVVGAGNMYSTPEDYLKIQQGLENGQILINDDYNYLADDNKPSIGGNGYHGGLYHEDNHQKWVRGTLSGTNYENGMDMDEDNQNGVILFTNQHIKPEPTNTLKGLAEQIKAFVKANN
ncbi:serine hydrolase domain-containing protein [Lentilactobacillus raoultii]|uniref:Serine hydrolase domain-containing protein n=1 Tax=Lentilactobacillus raoultii TaxID=1987503 RepID=A0ABW3PFJ5_9LACO|nr:serine hydrolase domain-containing protein [Lentilactobacillus raoultii]